MSEIVQKAEDFVVELLGEQLDPKFLYHNLRHTQRVVESTKELLDFYNLSEAEKDVLLLGAWFHDTGFTKGNENHEEASSDIASDFLGKQKYPKASIQKVNDIIMATKMGHKPQNLHEEIIRDADCSHFAQNSYWETNEFLKEELELLGIASYSFNEWREANIKMFKTEHQYYTNYAKEHWQEGKEKNLKRLKKDKKTKRK